MNLNYKRILIPGSKSYTNRALICAALADGTSYIRNASVSEDSLHLKDALLNLGANITRKDDLYVVRGCNPEKLSSSDLYIGATGTAMRFLTGLCSLVPGTHRISGTDRMHERPLGALVDSLNEIVEGELKLENKNCNGEWCPPVHIQTNGLKGGVTHVKVDSASQYLSSLLMASPYAKRDVLIKTVGNMMEKPYIDMTLDTMLDFGVPVFKGDFGTDLLEHKDVGEFYIFSGVLYKPTSYDVESDATGATYFMAAAALTGRKLAIGKFSPDSKQGDLKFANVLKRMGCNVSRNSTYFFVDRNRFEELKAVEVDFKNMPDSVQTLAVLAAVAEGETKIHNVSGLKNKETDRVKALITELDKLGVDTHYDGNTLTIKGGLATGSGFPPVKIKTSDDHRMAMSFSVLKLVCPEINIDNLACVSKSFPSFYKLLDSVEYASF